MEITVTGADGYLRLSKALKDGARELRKEMNKSLKEAAKPLIAETRKAALTQLPQRGGLAHQVARAPQRVQTRTGRNPGVRLVVSKRAGARATNRGEIRHPVFANPAQTRSDWTWVSQRVRGGWFDETVADHKAEIVLALERTMQDVLNEVARRARG